MKSGVQTSCLVASIAPGNTKCFRQAFPLFILLIASLDSFVHSAYAVARTLYGGRTIASSRKPTKPSSIFAKVWPISFSVGPSGIEAYPS